MNGYGAVPVELRERPQWVVWRREVRDGKPTKVPYVARVPLNRGAASGVRRRWPASSTDPSTWRTFFEAASVATDGGWDGIGFVFTAADPFVGIDLDDGLSEADRAAIILALDSYTETSVSGNGSHVFVRASLNGHGRNRRGPFEVYESGRYFVVTGNHVVGMPTTIEERQEKLEEVLAHFLPANEVDHAVIEGARPAPIDLDDRELIEKAIGAKNGAKFLRLWNGDTTGYGSASEADAALCGLLAFWTGGDSPRIDSLFRSSGLMRDKWERDDYREKTIGLVLAGGGGFYDPSSRSSSERTQGQKSDVSVAEKTGYETIESTPADPISDTSQVRPSGSSQVRPDRVRPFVPLSPERDEHERFVPGSSQAPSNPHHSWVPIDLVAAGAQPPTPPEIIDLFYPEYNHLLSGESEALKTWLALAASATELQAGRGVIWVDGDDVGKGALLERLRLLGADDDSIARLFAYMLPDEPFTDESRADVLEVVRRLACRLAVFDGFNPLLHLHGLDPNNGGDVETFYGLIDPIRKAGAANVLTDNVVKASEARGAWAIGSERKKSKAEVHLGMKTLEPFVRGGIGRAKIAVHKDRPGHLTRPSPGVLVLESRDDGCSWRVQPDDSRGADGAFRPTKLMENVSRYLERSGDEPQSRNQIESAKLGKGEYVRAAITCLIEEGHALEFSGSNRARLVRLERPFREGEESDL